MTSFTPRTIFPRGWVGQGVPAVLEGVSPRQGGTGRWDHARQDDGHRYPHFRSWYPRERATPLAVPPVPPVPLWFKDVSLVVRNSSRPIQVQAEPTR
jgi:hypothetical protein